MKDLHHFFTLLNSFFDKIYVITLERATDRHEHISKELDGLKYEFLIGKDKQNFTIEELQQNGIYDEALAMKHHRYGKPMPAGMIGCSWSHREVYQDILKNNYSKVLILEDDVVIDQQQLSLFSSVLQQLPAGWELIYFGFAEKEKKPPFAFLKQAIYHIQRLLGRLNYSHRTISNLYPKKITPHIYKAGYHDCTHAYGLTLSGAKKLLAHAITNEIVNGYIILPKIINQQYQVGISTRSYLNQ